MFRLESSEDTAFTPPPLPPNAGMEQAVPGVSEAPREQQLRRCSLSGALHAHKSKREGPLKLQPWASPWCSVGAERRDRSAEQRESDLDHAFLHPQR